MPSPKLMLRRTVELAAKIAATRHNLGKAFAERSELKEAILCFRSAIVRAEIFGTLIPMRRRPLMRFEQLDKVETFCLKAVEFSPAVPLVRFNLWTILDAKRRLTGAQGSVR